MDSPTSRAERSWEKFTVNFNPEGCFTKDWMTRPLSEEREWNKAFVEEVGRSMTESCSMPLMKSGKVRPCIKPSERILKSIPFLAKSISQLFVFQNTILPIQGIRFICQRTNRLGEHPVKDLPDPPLSLLSPILSGANEFPPPHQGGWSP